MVCKYLISNLNNIKYETDKEVIVETFSDKIACVATTYQCPKIRLKLRISQKCWQIKSQSPDPAGAKSFLESPLTPTKSPSPVDDTHEEAKQ